MSTTVGTEMPTTSIDELLDGFGRFIDAVIMPLEDENADRLNNPRELYNEDGSYSRWYRDLVREAKSAAAEAGYYSMFCPTSIGGGGLGYTEMFQTYEFIYHRYGPHRRLVQELLAHWAMGPSFLCTHFTEALRTDLLDDLLAGTVEMCFGMSEPDAGSDAWMMSTSATRDGDEWVINGTKQWTSNSPTADYCYLFAVTDPDLKRERRGGVSCFVVPMSAPGVQVDSVIRLFGEIGGNEGIVSFSNVRVPATHLVGVENQGFKLAMGGVSLGRLYNASRGVGLSRWLLEQATEHAKSRVTFGKPIAEYQGISFKLAESMMDIYAARCVSLDLAARLDRGEGAVRELAMAKAISVEALLRVADRCMQVCGAMGLTNEMHFYSAWHMARSLQLADGSAEILRVTVANRVLKGDVNF